MLKVAELNVSIGSIPIIRDASLFLDEGQMCGLIGRNGAGKTTLLRALMGALPASRQGRRSVDVDLLALPPHRRVAHGIGYMPEDRRLVPEFTVEENIRLPSLGDARRRRRRSGSNGSSASCRRWRVSRDAARSSSPAASRRWSRWRAR